MFLAHQEIERVIVGRLSGWQTTQVPCVLIFSLAPKAGRGNKKCNDVILNRGVGCVTYCPQFDAARMGRRKKIRRKPLE
jgi:hypothetical protein